MQKYWQRDVRSGRQGGAMKLMQYGATAVRVANLDGIVMADVEGPVTGETARLIIEGARSWAPTRSAQVVDYSRANIAITPDQLYAAAVAARGPSEPTAFVVRPDRLADFRRYAALTAERGILKVAFLSLEQAGAWAAEQAAVKEYWDCLERRRRAWP